MRAGTILLLLSSIVNRVQSRDFDPPDAAERLQAIGPTGGLPEVLRKALDPGSDFQPIARPGPGDWLASHQEEGQSFKAFVQAQRPGPDKERRKIYLLPVGEFPEDRSPPLESLKKYTAAYFKLPVEVLPPKKIDGLNLTTRKNPHSGNLQLLTGDVLALLRKELPGDAFALVGITLTDLYPLPSWNYVFGQAMPAARVGVYSFARYDPVFFGEPRGKDSLKLIRHRSAKVLAHEIGHLFGLEHCIYFNCVMNGSNNLPEADARPLEPCPVCLRKLQHSIGFDVVERYEGLERWFDEAGFVEEAKWVQGRLPKLKPTRKP